MEAPGLEDFRNSRAAVEGSELWGSVLQVVENGLIVVL